MSDTLYIAAKAPRPRVSKTRLGREIGHDNAARLYRGFLADLAARFADGPFALGWYITPPDAWDDIEPLLGPDGRADRVLVQYGEDWTERQRRLFHECSDHSDGRVVLIASDSPHLSVRAVEEAFRSLEANDLVFGPTYDGGYYLIGMRGYHDVLGGVPMSTGTVLQEIIRKARRSGLSVGWVGATFDIDEVEDLDRLRQVVDGRRDMSCTRKALREIGLH